MWSMCGKATSAANRPRPRTRGGSSSRGTERPTTLMLRSFSEHVPVRCGHRKRQTRSAPSPALATELEFTRVQSLNDWPKSDISDFGWRAGVGADWHEVFAERPGSWVTPWTGDMGNSFPDLFR